jgi:hypothetical protein
VAEVTASQTLTQNNNKNNNAWLQTLASQSLLRPAYSLRHTLFAQPKLIIIKQFDIIIS